MTTTGRMNGWHVGLEVIPAILVAAIISFLIGKKAKRRWATACLPLIGAVAGAALAVDAVGVTGYVADYSFAGAWALSLLFIGAALPMLPFPSLRRGGLIAFVTGASVLTVFYIVVTTAKLLGMTTWKT